MQTRLQDKGYTLRKQPIQRKDGHALKINVDLCGNWDLIEQLQKIHWDFASYFAVEFNEGTAQQSHVELNSNVTEAQIIELAKICAQSFGTFHLSVRAKHLNCEYIIESVRRSHQQAQAFYYQKVDEYNSSTIEK